MSSPAMKKHVALREKQMAARDKADGLPPRPTAPKPKGKAKKAKC